MKEFLDLEMDPVTIHSMDLESFLLLSNIILASYQGRYVEVPIEKWAAIGFVDRSMRDAPLNAFLVNELTQEQVSRNSAELIVSQLEKSGISSANSVFSLPISALIERSGLSLEQVLYSLFAVLRFVYRKSVSDFTNFLVISGQRPAEGLRLAKSGKSDSILSLQIESIFGEFQNTQRLILEYRTFSQDPMKFRELSELLREMGEGLSHERVRQLELESRSKFVGLLEQPQYSLLRNALHKVRRSIGDCATKDEILDVIKRRPLLGEEQQVLEDEDAFLILMIYLGLSSRHVEDRGLLIRRGLKVKEIVHRVFEPDGFIHLWDLEERLFATAVSMDAFLLSMDLQRLKQFQLGHEFIIDPTLRTEDLLHVAYSLLDEPHTIDDVLESLQLELNPRSVQDRLKCDSRFIRVGKGRVFALVDWGYEKYEGIAREMEKALLKSDGQMEFQALIDELTTKFQANRKSIEMYSSAPRFRVHGKWIVLVEPTELDLIVPEIPSGIEYSIQEDSKLMIWNRPVDIDLIRGSGKAIPKGVAAYLGVQPSDSVVYKSESGEQLTFTWNPLSQHPSVSSMKQLADKLGTCEGDYLCLEFDLARKSFSARLG